MASVRKPPRMRIDMIGRFVAQGVFPEGWVLGDPMPAPVLSSGWRVNVTPDLIAANPALEAFIVTPARLGRVWAGDSPSSPSMTVALRFASEAEAEAQLDGLSMPAVPVG